MAKARFFVDRGVAATGNLWSASTSTVSASSEATALPAAATRNPDRTYPWRSAVDTGEAALDLDLGTGYTSYPVTAVALANVRLLGTGVVKLQERGTGSSPGTATDVLTLPAMDAGRRITYGYPASPVTARHYRLLFTNPTSAEDFAEVGYVFIGQYFEPAVNFSTPADFPYEDPSVARVSESGQATFVERTPYYAGDLTFSDLAQSDFDALHAIYQIVRGTTPFFLVLDANQAWQNALVQIVGGLGINRGRSVGRTTVRCPYQEWR